MEPGPRARPLVSVTIAVYNGRRWFDQTLASLVGQDYENIEIVILDNQSSDGTQELCRAYAERDPRIRFIVDDARRPLLEAQRKVFGLARGDYWFGACDDDIYDPRFVRTLVDLLEARPDVGLAYSGLEFIDERDVVTPAPLNANYFRTADDSRFSNFAFFMLRTPNVPMVMGIMRREVAQEAFAHYDEVAHNMGFHDSKLMLGLLSRTLVDSASTPLFQYRQKDRRESTPVVPPEYRRSRLTRHAFAVKCRLRFRQDVHEIIDGATAFSAAQKAALHAWNEATTAFFCAGGHVAFVALRERFPGLFSRFGLLSQGEFDEGRV